MHGHSLNITFISKANILASHVKLPVLTATVQKTKTNRIVQKIMF